MVSILKVFCTMLFLVFALSLQDAVADEAFELYGTVYLSSSPIADAHVELRDATTGYSLDETVTNEAGHYNFNVAPGIYRLTVTPPAILDLEPVIVDNIEVKGSDVVQNVILLLPAQELTGSIVGLRDAPIENASISIYTKNRESLITSITADNQGEFQVALSPGDYYLSIHFRQQSHPGAPTYADYHHRLQVSAETSSVVIQLPVVEVAGFTTDANGVPIPGVRIETTNSGYGPDVDGFQESWWISHTEHSVVSDQDGFYSMWLFAQFTEGYSPNYTLSAIPPEHVNNAVTLVELALIRQDDRIDIVLQNANTIEGRIQGLRDAPIENASISIYTKNRESLITSITADNQGEFQVALSPGDYYLSIHFRQQSHPGAPTYADYHHRLQVSAETSSVVIQLPVVEVAGFTTDANGVPIPGVRIETTNSGYGPDVDGFQESWWISHTEHSVVSDQDGFYSMWLFAQFTEGYSPNYTLSAIPPEHVNNAVTLVELALIRQDDRIDIVLQNANTIEGRIQGLRDAPIENASISIYMKNRESLITSITADNQGEFQVALSPGDYYLSIHFRQQSHPGAPTYADYHHRLQVSAETSSIVIQLPVVEVAGFTTDANGVPIPGVRIETINHGYGPDVDGFQESWWISHTEHSVVSDQDGFYSMWLFAQFTEGYSPNYTLNILPPEKSGFSITPVNNYHVNQSQQLGIIMPFDDTSAPEFIGGPFVSEISSTSAVISWNMDKPVIGQVSWNGASIKSSEYKREHTLLLEALSPGTEYSVWVHASDKAGNQAEPKLVTFITSAESINRPPMIIAGPTVISITHNSAIVQWETDKAATSQLNGDVRINSDDYTTMHQIELTNLTSDTLYQVWVSSTDHYGDQSAEHSLEFLTRTQPDTAAPVIIEGPWFTDITATGATVLWRTDEPATSGVSFNDGEIFGVLTDQTLRLEHSIRISNLIPDTQYFVTVSSTDAAGNGPTLSETQEIVTLSAAEIDAPPTFTESPEVCNVNHQLIQICFRNDRPVSTIIQYGVKPDMLVQQVVRSQSIRHHTIPITGLEANTTYYFKVTVQDNQGQESSSDTLIATTSETGEGSALQFIQPPVISYQGHDRAVLSFRSNVPTDVVVEYGVSDFSERAVSTERQRNHSIVLSNLEHGQSYQFRLTASDVDGNTLTFGFDNIENEENLLLIQDTSLNLGNRFTTRSDVDRQPPQMTVSPSISITHDRAIVTWQTNKPADSRVRFGSSMNDLRRAFGDIAHTNTHNVTLTNLVPKQSYYYQIISRDPVGNEFVSEVQSFSTSDVSLHTVSIVKQGDGHGRVNGAGLDCGEICTLYVTVGSTITLTAVANSDSSFVSWGFSACDDELSHCSLTINADTTLSPEFLRKETSPTTYTVTFWDWDQRILSTQTITAGEHAIAPTDPERDGYTFIGWDVPFNAVTSDLDVTAQYDIRSFTVRFLDWDDSVLSTQMVNWNTAAEAPAVPEREGHIFIGWSTEFDLITADLDVTAQYEIQVLLVSAMVIQANNQGQVTPMAQEVVYGGSAVFSATTSQRLKLKPVTSNCGSPVIQNGNHYQINEIKVDCQLLFEFEQQRRRTSIILLLINILEEQNSILNLNN